MSLGWSRARRAVVAAAGVSAAAALLFLGAEGLERDFGLRALFALRGVRPAPAQVAIVNIDSGVAGRLGLPPRPDRWPRALHAEVLRALRAAGAGVVAYDMAFDQPRSREDDERFAAQMREAGNVVLVMRSEQTGSPAGGGTSVRLERLVPPIPALEQAAAATAPFTLPKIPARVDRSWNFKPGAGDSPTLPLAALLVYARPALQELVQAVGAVDAEAGRALAGGGTAGLAALRGLARAQPARLERWRRSAAGRMGGGSRGRLADALLDALAAGDAPFLDFYGPAGTIRTLPFDSVAQSAARAGGVTPPLGGAAVFVGFAERATPEQPDAFLTVFSRPDGVDLSGVEIAATAFANLLESRHPRQPRRWLLLPAIVAWGAGLGAACSRTGLALSALIATAAGAAWLGCAALAFRTSAAWVPVVVPAGILPPLAWGAGLLLRHFQALQERRAIVRALGHYLPAEAVRSALRGLEPALLGRTVYAVCLCTDVAGYTRLSERLDPAALRERMNRYFAVLFAEVRRGGGVVMNVVGDAMLALWITRKPEAGAALAACRAAVALSEAAPGRPDGDGADLLPTRAAVHAGAIVLGTLGAAEHYEFAPIGDIVNTASRLESLAKKLGVGAVVSAVAAPARGEVSVRPLGSFLLAGKTLPVEVLELRGADAGAAPGLDEAFGRALAAWKAGAPAEAQGLFEECERIAPKDGPTLFYLQFCRDLRELGGDTGGDGVVCLGSK